MQLPQLDTLLLGNQFVGIELFSLNGADAAAQVMVKKKKDELFFESKEMRSNYDHFIEKPSKGIPVFLTVNNSHIIHKEVEGIEKNNSKLLYKAFPNLKVEDFFYEIWRLDSVAVIAICRKSYLNELLLNFKEKQISISGISLGVCGIATIKNFIEEPIVKTNSQTISLENETSILSPNENNLVKSFNINGLEVENTYLLSFTSVLQNIVPTTTSGSITEFNTTLFADFKQNSLFRNGFKWAVYSLLILLLINFFLFNYYFKKANETNTTIVANKSLIEDMKSTKERIKNKEDKLGNNNGYLGIKNSYLINEMVKNVPNSVLLSELTYHPIEKKIKENEKITFESDRIILAGSTNNPTELTNWFEELDELDWIENTTILHFGKNEENQTVFTLQLKIDPNEAK